MSLKSLMPSNHLILCHPILLLPSIFPSIRVFSNESVIHIRWPKYWSFSFSISPSNEYSGIVSFTTDWFDLAVQGTLKSSSPTPQFKSISSLALSFVYGPTLTDNCSFVVKFWNWEVWVLQLCSNFSGLFWILWVPWSSLCFWRVISLWCLARIYLLTEASGVDLQICVCWYLYASALLCLNGLFPVPRAGSC